MGGSLDVLEVSSSLSVQRSPATLPLASAIPSVLSLLCCPVELRCVAGKDRRDRLGEKMQESLCWEGGSGCGWVHTGRGRFLTCCSIGLEAEKDGVPVFKLSRWRVKGQTLPDVVAKYQALGAELNVLPFCSQFIPMEVINAPHHGSIIYHPSLLPRHRGASAINW